jgi:Protein of unknown function (DUF2934)
MPTKSPNYQNHQHAAELNDLPAHNHIVAEQQGKGEHLAGHEQSRQAMEHSTNGHTHNQPATVGHGVTVFGHREIAALAHKLWEDRGCPAGSPEEDWFHAAEILRSKAHTPSA